MCRPSLLALALIGVCGCSVPKADPELAARALDVTPAPGKTRIYIFRPDRVFGSTARLKVAIDSVYIGKIQSGSFMMVELEPGQHRVSGPSDESDRGIVLETMADSTYFVKIWPKMGFWSSQSGVEQLDAVEGRRVIRENPMVVSNWPGELLLPDTTSAATKPSTIIN